MNAHSIKKTLTLFFVGLPLLGFIVGEVFRLPFLQERGVLIFDLLLAVSVVGLLGVLFVTKAKPFLNRSIVLLLIFFAVIALSLLIHIPLYDTSSILKGALYALRTIGVLSIITMLPSLIHSKKDVTIIMHLLTAAAVILSLIGFLQLVIFPNFTEMAQLGWDPHEGRLLSSWFDPNYVGGFFALITTLLVNDMFTKGHSKRYLLWTYVSISILLIANLLTYSRSALLALVAGVTVVLFVRSKKLLIAAIVLGCLTVAFTPRLWERTTDMIDGLVTLSKPYLEQNLDPTSQLRILDWERSVALWQKEPFLGVGYNLLSNAKLEANYLHDQESHTASGSDSSLLTILITTGVIGLATFLCFLLSLLITSIQAIQLKVPEAVGYLGFLIALITHSFFVNSMLYPYITYTFAVVTGYVFLASMSLREGRIPEDDVAIQKHS